jgi:hypothetical protein
MNKAYVRIVFLALALSMTVACGKREESAAPVNEARGGVLGLANGVARVNINGGVSKVDYTNIVKAFLSPTISPSEVGDVDPTTGVRFGGRVMMNGTNGAIDPNSQIQFEVIDHLVGTLANNQTYQPIPVTFKGGVTANSMAYNGNANITFEDEFGSVNIRGTFQYKGGNFTGTVYFSNASANHNGIKSGTLGTFSVPTCSFFVCN